MGKKEAGEWGRDFSCVEIIRKEGFLIMRYIIRMKNIPQSNLNNQTLRKIKAKKRFMNVGYTENKLSNSVNSETYLRYPNPIFAQNMRILSYIFSTQYTSLNRLNKISPKGFNAPGFRVKNNFCLTFTGYRYSYKNKCLYP